MKKRVKGLLVLWLALLMVASTPMTANAAISNIILYDGTEPLKANLYYKYDDIYKDKFKVLFADPSEDGTTTPALEAFSEGKKTLINDLVGNNLSTQTGYTQVGWKLWNSTSGYSLSNPSKIVVTDYGFEVPNANSSDYPTSDYKKYIAEYSEYMAIEPVWELNYKITPQPSDAEPYIQLNDAGNNAEKSFQWYKYADKDSTQYVSCSGGEYNKDTRIWNIVEGVATFRVNTIEEGYILQITPKDSADLFIEDYDNIFSLCENEKGVWYCERKTGVALSPDDSRGLNVSNTAGVGGPFAVEIKVFQPVEGQDSNTYSGENGNVLCKVDFTNGASLYSDSFTYTSYSITAKPTTNGSYSLQVGGQEVTKAIPGSEVAVVATADEGYKLESISVTPDGGDAKSIEFKDPTTFIMPDCPISVDVAFKKRTYGITLPTSQVGYSVNPVLVEGEQKTSVEHGDSFTFDVSIAEGYAAANNYAVKANGTTLTATSSKDNVYTYTIENITAEQEITVTGVEKTYPVAMSEAANGSFLVAAEDGSSTSGAVKGTIFTITPTPAEGYELDTLTVIQKDGSDTAVTVDDKNQFTMPEYPVEVSVTFKKKTYGITLPQGQTGYTVSSSQTSPVEHGSDYTFKVTISDGYDVPTALSVKANGTVLVATNVSGKEYTYTLEKVAAAQEITVDGVSDITDPEVTITLDAEHTWKHFLFKIGFGLFFQEEKKLTIDAVDTGSGRGSVTYYVSETDLFPTEETYSAEEIEKRIPQWTEYSGAVFISVDRSYVVYAKATDIAGNVTYVSTSGMVIDTTKPVISGLEDGGQYYGDTSTTISDANLSAVKLDGKAVEFTGTSASVTITADGAEHTIEATDKAGNQTAYKVTVSETWVRDGISSAGSRALKLGVPYKFGTGKWKVAGDTTVYEGGNTFYASEGGTFEFQTQ